jgi:hypothetical protein
LESLDKIYCIDILYKLLYEKEMTMVGLRNFRMALAGCAVLCSQVFAFAAGPEGTKLYIFSSG